MKAEYKDDSNAPGYYINGDIQWHNGKDYMRYCHHFDNIFSGLYPPNKINTQFRHILIIGGGDMQLLSNTTMLSSDCRTKLVDPMVHEYQKMLIENKDKISKHIFKSQRFAYTETAFMEFIPTTIQEFLDDEKYSEDTFDLIVCDLIDGLAVDADNEYTSRVWDRLRPGGIMIGYGGATIKNFLENSIVPLLDVSQFSIEQRDYQSWGPDTGVVYGAIKGS